MKQEATDVPHARHGLNPRPSDRGARQWGVTFVSDWTSGSAMTWEQGGVTISDPAQIVLEAEPCSRLSYTWHTFTPEFVQAFGLGDELLAKAANERRSKVTFDIAPLGPLVRLTVIHDDFDPGSVVLEKVSEGWPMILSSLKTLLETGEALPFEDEPERLEEESLPA